MTDRGMLVIGNSHLKALREAYYAEDREGVAFHSVRAGYSLERRDGGLHVVSRGVHYAPFEHEEGQSVDISPFGVIVITACGWWAPRNDFVEHDIADQYVNDVMQWQPSTLAHPLAHVVIADRVDDWDRVQSSVRGVTRAVFGLTVSNWVRRQVLCRMVTDICSSWDGRVIVDPWPPPNELVRQDGNWFLNRWYGGMAGMIWGDYFRAQLAALRSMASGFGDRCTLLDYGQRADENGFMPSNLGADYSLFHANAEYARDTWRQIDWLVDPRGFEPRTS